VEDKPEENKKPFRKSKKFGSKAAANKWIIENLKKD
jgi:hypothetical protein